MLEAQSGNTESEAETGHRACRRATFSEPSYQLNPWIFLAFCCLLLHEADSAAILPASMPYEADSAAILPFMLPYEADSDALLQYFSPYEADRAAISPL